MPSGATKSTSSQFNGILYGTMRIIAWLRQRSLERRKKGYTHRLSEIQTSLQKLRTREPVIRSLIKPELARIRELKKQLKQIKSEKELQFWCSLFNMCVPLFEALLKSSQTNNNTRRLKKDPKK